MSPLIQPDTSEATGSQIEPGTYKATIKSATPGTSKKNNPKIDVLFSVEVGGKLRERHAHLVVSGEGAFNFDQLLRAVGMASLADAYKAKDGTKPPFDTDSLVGQVVNLVFDTRMYTPEGSTEAEPRDEIKKYLKA